MKKVTCTSCRHFDDQPHSLEAQLPGITILSSAFASVRGEAGICRVFGRFMDPLDGRACPHFSDVAVGKSPPIKTEEHHD